MDWLTHTLTLAVAVSFIVGAVGGQTINWLLNRRKTTEGTVRQRFQVVVGLAIVVTMVFIMVTTYNARECALRLNVSISTEQDIAKIERDALTQVFFEASNPPGNIAALPQDDPARKEWGKQIGAEYFAKVQEAARQRQANQRAQNEARKACGT